MKKSERNERREKENVQSGKLLNKIMKNSMIKGAVWKGRNKGRRKGGRKGGGKGTDRRRK